MQKEPPMSLAPPRGSRRSGPRPRRSGAALGLLAAVLLGASLLGAGGCSVNPATGKRQLALVSEEQEIAMGKEADAQIPQQLGLYEDRELQEYVDRIGQRLAAESERPHLPWTFRVVDDDVVNAFALPGGFIYVTRGILSHMNDEAELAGVLGHEIGHVTARHSVNQMSKGMLAQIGLGVGSVLSPEVANLAGLAQQGLSLLFLKYGRDDERQADELAFRYGAREGYDPRSLIDLFALLERVGQRSEGGGLPGWMLTHPQPEARREEAEKVVASLTIDLDDLRRNRDTFLGHLDGMVYGADPRQGYFRGQRFFHPEMRFELAFPNDWKTMNMRQAVVAQQPDGQAVVTLTLASQSDAQSAAKALADQGATPVREWRDRIGGERAVSYYWTANLQGTPAAGLAAFVEHGGNVYRMLAYTAEVNFDRYRDDLESSLASFGPLEDRRVLAVQPLRVRLERLDRPMTIDRVAKQYDVPIAVEDLALLNNVDPGTELDAGAMVKIVDGEPPP
jgi:predicted Zn-dependent protease